MTLLAWRLRRRLRRAALLYASGGLTKVEYATIAIDSVARLQAAKTGARPRTIEGATVGWVEFPMKALPLLKRRNETWPDVDIERSMSLYGPYNEAATWMAEMPGVEKVSDGIGSVGFRWNEAASQKLDDAMFKLSRVNRAQYAVERWLAVRQKRLPLLTGVIGKLVMAVLAAVLGFVFGRLTKS